MKLFAMPRKAYFGRRPRPFFRRGILASFSFEESWVEDALPVPSTRTTMGGGVFHSENKG